MGPSASLATVGRRRFMHAGAIAAGMVSGSGCFTTDDREREGSLLSVDAADKTDDAGQFPTYGILPYADWIPTSRHDGSPEVYFSHVDVEHVAPLGPWATSGSSAPDRAVLEAAPIVGLPLVGVMLDRWAIGTIAEYPFTADLTADSHRVVGRLKATRRTWVDDIIVIHGTFDPTVFPDRYAAGFDASDGTNGFTVYVGAEEETAHRAYAVSDSTLVILIEREEQDIDPAARIKAATDSYAEESERLVDVDVGTWLFETTGNARQAFGAWQAADLQRAVTDLAPGPAIDAVASSIDSIGDLPVIADAEHVMNVLTFDLVNGDPSTITARFAGNYPDETAPSTTEIETQLVGDAMVEELVIDHDRVYVSASVDTVLHQE